MSAEAALLVTMRLTQLATALIEINAQIMKVNFILTAAQREGRVITPEEWAKLDADLAAAEQAAIEARILTKP